ncbi:ATP-binding response regulator [Leptospira sp. GIMC2001]|uniref:ATP-binding response regulator n=1 Tax=Leptospira sp. GIMC2001 TaxID=1513297 RepID=UPI002349577A|nr:response regulator [Leptospira sp. GIMC2001]WCL48779.1 response regulator [Leptospira sp. GIMC2001]
MRILFVDDEPSIRELFQITLGSEYELELAEDGIQALSLAKNSKFDLIITDISLPKMSGVEFIRRLRADSIFTPFIIITGDSNIELAIDTFRMGAVDFFLKPFRIESLRIVLERFKSLHLEPKDVFRAGDLVHESDTSVYVLAPKIRKINYFVNIITDRMRSLSNIQEDDILALKVTLYELISNAIEHGTAGIDYNQKKKFLEDSGDYFNLVEKKCDETDKKITINTSYNYNKIQVEIIDEGNGFNPSSIPDPLKNPTANLYSGRGIFLTKLNVDEIEYNDIGNSVRIVRYLKPV